MSLRPVLSGEQSGNERVMHRLPPKTSSGRVFTNERINERRVIERTESDGRVECMNPKREERGLSSDGSAEFVCGFGAAFINICLTFPIHKIMFRQMVDGVRTRHAIAELRAEGFFTLYRGILPPLISKTITVSIMFGTYSEYRTLIERNFPRQTSPFVTLSIAAILAGFTEAVLTPFERIQMLLQDKKFHDTFNNTFHTFRELQKYGVKEYYRGLSPILIRNALSNVMFFSLRNEVKSAFPKTDLWYTDVLEDFVSGALTGALISTVFYPLNVIKTKMQTVEVGTEFMSMRNASRLVYEERQRSLRKIFYGVHLNYTRALLSWGIINASYEILKKIVN
ncbi:solute carrier family 25 member 51-like protein [Dinothrombium tinctorium]|uniref:Solute carrier family 25 member 51-like protein n=1 Tax=Dinothrombium tinctorium TaxID=1965070 RepID=A0A443R6N5_9ACAR|nr:solute carrier family 25 member 51-like protein [Dinothrombium tinctorium]